MENSDILNLNPNEIHFMNISTNKIYKADLILTNNSDLNYNLVIFLKYK